jgi:homoserine dehydrogenase
MRASEDENVRPVTTPRDVPIALLGYGAVGSAVDRHLRVHEDELAAATGLRLRVVHALVRDLSKQRGYPPLDGVLTTSFDRILEDQAVVAVAELMGGIDTTRRYIDALLEDGKGVATANKQLLAHQGRDLFSKVRIGGSVCGAIPLVETLVRGLPPGACTRVSGIVNGTTNYLLTRVESGSSWVEAIGEARRRHYVEQDPTEDLSGADAAAKMAIIASLAFGELVTIDDVAYEGIEGLDEHDVRAARTRGRALRLVGSATRSGVSVRVAELDQAHPFAQLCGADNAVLLEGTGFRQILLAGPGAGGQETASAVVADLFELVR